MLTGYFTSLLAQDNVCIQVKSLATKGKIQWDGYYIGN